MMGVALSAGRSPSLLLLYRLEENRSEGTSWVTSSNLIAEPMSNLSGLKEEHGGKEMAE